MSCTDDSTRALSDAGDLVRVAETRHPRRLAPSPPGPSRDGLRAPLAPLGTRPGLVRTTTPARPDDRDHPLRVAIIAPPWVPVPPPAYGGTEAVLDCLARGMDAAGHEVLLFTTGDSTCPVPSKWIRDAAAGTVNASAATELHHVVHAYRAVQEWGADIVHDHTLTGPIYARELDVPVVTTNHGPFAGELGDYYRAIAGRVPIIAISHHHARSAGDLRVAAVIHHGLDVDAVPVGSGDGGYALFLGRMNADKGVHTAIEIARRAGVPLKIAAKLREPAELEYFETRVKPLLGGDIEYVGEVGGALKQDLIGRAMCLLNPIAWPEPFGMVMIEALAAGTPVVATAHGSVPEIVIDGVTGFIRDDLDELVEAVQSLHLLDRATCRRDAVVRFSTERMVAEHVEAYRAVIAGHRFRRRRHGAARPSGAVTADGARA
jgi:glycosyltransferase involved in cell wall biosynthesis